MATRMPYLSKSRLLSAWQCPKKLHLETHFPELGEVSQQTESLFEAGHRVGAIAQTLYGSADSVEVAFDFRTMLAETRELIERGVDFPIFEASFRYQGVLVRVDVMRPDAGGWHVTEVKSSTSVKDYHVLDCAIQDWVLRHSGIKVLSVSLAHINNQFVYPGDDNYEGLFLEHDLSDRIRSLRPRVPELLAKARAAVSGPMPEIAVGAHCKQPFDCQFIGHCWPSDTRYPITGLGGRMARLGELVSLGYHDILDLDENSLSSPTQQRIYRVTLKGEPEILDGARRILSALPYPRYYLDFETIGPAVPVWKGTRPFQVIPVQWSVHIEDPGGTRHEEFLDLSGAPPMRPLAERLIAVLGDRGPVLVYTSYESQVIKNLIEMFDDLAEPLGAILARLFDLHPVVKANYYHPDMLGSWSIKAVLPCIAPRLNYAALDGIRDGTAASAGFLEAIGRQDQAAAPTAARKAELREQLLRYCRFDTEAMLEIVRYFSHSSSGF